MSSSRQYPRSERRLQVAGAAVGALCRLKPAFRWIPPGRAPAPPGLQRMSTVRTPPSIFATMTAAHAVFERGMYRPLEPVELPERCEVEEQAAPGGAGTA